MQKIDIGSVRTHLLRPNNGGEINAASKPDLERGLTIVWREGKLPPGVSWRTPEFPAAQSYTDRSSPNVPGGSSSTSPTG